MNPLFARVFYKVARADSQGAFRLHTWISIDSNFNLRCVGGRDFASDLVSSSWVLVV